MNLHHLLSNRLPIRISLFIAVRITYTAAGGGSGKLIDAEVLGGGQLATGVCKYPQLRMKEIVGELTSLHVDYIPTVANAIGRQETRQISQVYHIIILFSSNEHCG